jgi:hypothetical protein
LAPFHEYLVPRSPDHINVVLDQNCRCIWKWLRELIIHTPVPVTERLIRWIVNLTRRGVILPLLQCGMAARVREGRGFSSQQRTVTRIVRTNIFLTRNVRANARDKSCSNPPVGISLCALSSREDLKQPENRDALRRMNLNDSHSVREEGGGSGTEISI